LDEPVNTHINAEKPVFCGRWSINRNGFASAPVRIIWGTNIKGKGQLLKEFSDIDRIKQDDFSVSVFLLFGLGE